MIDDAGCLRKYAELRDENAFTEFVRQNVAFVYSAAFRQAGGDVHLAEDIVQKVFTAAAKKAGALGAHPSIGAWLHQTTRYVAIDALRSRRRRESRESAASEMTETISEPDVSTEWDRISPELDRIVASLGESDRDAVILRFFGGKSFADIGARLNLSENAARMRVDRALEKLRSRLSRVGLTSSCAALSAMLAENGVMAAPAGLGAAAIATALSAPAAVGLSLASGILQIMPTTKITLGAAAIVTLMSLAAAVHEHRHAQVAEQALADAARTSLAMRHAATRANPPSGQPGARSDRPAPSGGATATAGGPGSGVLSLMDLLGNPAIQQQNEILAELRMDGQYSALFKSLNLSAEQIDQLKRLLLEKEMVGFDSMSAAEQHGIEPASDPRGFFQAVAEAEKTVDVQISTLLGANGYGQFQQYQETIPARNTSNLLGQALSYTAAPLTDAQTAGLIQVLTQNGTPALPPSNPFAVLNGDLGVIKVSDQGLAQIQGILSPPQVQALQEKMLQQSQILEARKQIRP